MKDIKNFSEKFLHFEIARLRTLYDRQPDIRLRIVKRYKLIVDEYNSRGLGWFWSKHILDKLIKDDWCSEAGGSWITIKGNHICIFKDDSEKENYRKMKLNKEPLHSDLPDTVKDDASLRKRINMNDRRKELWSKYQEKLDEAPEGFDDIITRRVVIGSFVTDKENPSDIDVVIFTNPNIGGVGYDWPSEEVKRHYWELFHENTDVGKKQDVSILLFDDNVRGREAVEMLIVAGQTHARGYGKEYKGVQH